MRHRRRDDLPDRQHDERDQRGMADAARAETLDDARIEPVRNRDRCGDCGKGIGKDVGRVENVGKDLLRRIEKAEQSAHDDPAGQDIAQCAAV